MTLDIWNGNGGGGTPGAPPSVLCVATATRSSSTGASGLQQNVLTATIENPKNGAVYMAMGFTNITPSEAGQFTELRLKYGINADIGGTQFGMGYVDHRTSTRTVFATVTGMFTYSGADDQDNFNVVLTIAPDSGTANAVASGTAPSSLYVFELTGDSLKGEKGDPGSGGGGGGGGGGGIEAIVEGDHIDVDSTDPANPTVSVDTTLLTTDSDYWNLDTHACDGPGTQVATLTWVPVELSLIVWWGGWKIPTDQWSLDGNILTVTDIAEAFTDEDELSFWYKIDRTQSPAAPEPEDLIAYGSSGWKYLQTTLGDATDYSDPDFDDSGWATGSMKFKESGGGTTWAIDTSIWVRKTFPASYGVTVEVSVEDWCEIWINGEFVGGSSPIGLGGTHISPPVTVTPRNSLTADGNNVLVVRAYDEAATNSGDQTELDVRVTGIPF